MRPIVCACALLLSAGVNFSHCASIRSADDKHSGSSPNLDMGALTPPGLMRTGQGDTSSGDSANPVAAMQKFFKELTSLGSDPALQSAMQDVQRNPSATSIGTLFTTLMNKFGGISLGLPIGMPSIPNLSSMPLSIPGIGTTPAGSSGSSGLPSLSLAKIPGLSSLSSSSGGSGSPSLPGLGQMPFNLGG